MALARKPFVVIDAEILSSSVWSEAAHVRLVWITLLILCDTEGYVGAAIPGIARAAGVTLEEAREAMERLQQPDKDSRTQANEGRRVAIVPRGFQVLNFREHLDRLSAERAKSRERVRRFRAKRGTSVTVTPGNVTVTTGSREQGIGNSEQGVGTEERTLPSLPPPPEQRAEEETRGTIHRLQLKLGALLTALSEHNNSRQRIVDWCRECSSYEKPDGTRIKGASDYRTITSIDRLERSISDAEWWLEELDGGRVVGPPELVKAAEARNGTRK